MIHKNTRKAWSEFDAPKRALAVMRMLRFVGGPMTDRELCIALGARDMNYARPSITRLKQDGVLREVDNVRCPVTGRTVRRVWFAEGKR